MNHKLNEIVSRFATKGTISEIKPLGNGLINDTYRVNTADASTPDYVLQRINHHIFTDVEGLQNNIAAVTRHLRRKLEAEGAEDIDRRVLTFLPLKDSDKTYYYDGESYWRMMVFIPDAYTFEEVNPHYARHAGAAFGRFQAQLVDIPDKLVESIPDFHNMEFRLKQLDDAVKADAAGRLKEVQPIVDDLLRRAEAMTAAERLYREGKLPKRVCHCDTKVNNMMFDAEGRVLCVIDLDTVMPSFIFSDYGDFLRTGACTSAEDEPDLSKVNFNMDIFKAFTEGYLSEARTFLTPTEIEMLPYAAALFPYMQAVRFLTDYINGDTYYKIAYPEHNLVRTRAQVKMLESVEEHTPEMVAYINELLKK
ncbi:MAG: aminoglycoside phosphotransferase family protein [Muribaculaceae bacterium]|nr:aminoglycoside phosphotransferase family protein [Muribaculaceae bacterium]